VDDQYYDNVPSRYLGYNTLFNENSKHRRRNDHIGRSKYYNRVLGIPNIKQTENIKYIGTDINIGVWIIILLYMTQLKSKHNNITLKK